MLMIQEQWINKSEGYRTGETEVYETFTNDKGELFRDLQKEYGRCTGKMYVDKTDGSTLCVGWIFEKRQKYDDSPETFLLETWISVHKAEPTRTVQCHYLEV